ncbi:MAG: SUF system Fe-S cluster assembly protein [Alphaproteobacteria bacterium]|nr:SUF system Fe-S cluster assembly protein [Alphaproteobacteria bacterium]
MSENFLEEFMEGPAETAPDDAVRDQIVEKLKTIYDPEIPVNIYELGLIYGLDVTAENDVKVTMTLTTPMCPVAESMPGEVEAKVREVDGVNEVDVELVWDPPWDMTKLSEAAKLELGMM